MRAAPRLIAVCVVSAFILAGCGGDDEPGAATTTSTAPTTTSDGSTTSTSGATDEVPDEAVWPRDAGRAFSDPGQAANSFVLEYLGMPSPSLSPFKAGDSRSGEVDVRPKPGAGPTTTVLVRQLTASDAWYVIGSASPNLRLTTPLAGATITSPVSLRGESTAFEATIQVGVREDGQTGEQYLGKTHTMGGSMGEMGPFSVSLQFEAAQQDLGAVVLWVYSAEDGAVSEATVTRIRF